MMHGTDDATSALAEQVLRYVRDRTTTGQDDIGATASPEYLANRVGRTITPDGLGAPRAFELFEEELERACITTDSPVELSFVPAAPTKAATLFDVAISAASIDASTWLEGAGAIYAENQVIDWLVDLAGLPTGAGGCFVSGGTNGNLSALAAARHHVREVGLASHDPRPRASSIVVADSAHASIELSARVMDAELVRAARGASGPLTGVAVAEALESADGRVFAVVASAGTTNTGMIDELAAIGEVCRAAGVWFHVDGAYGLAGLAAPSIRHLYDGIELADSFIVDPHKWFFAPYDACALIYRSRVIASDMHKQGAAYLDPVADEVNPSDFAVHLSRRARGLPFWFSLAANGTDAYANALTTTLTTAQRFEQMVEESDHLELVCDRTLTVVVFRRSGWTAEDYDKWSDRTLADKIAFVVPTKFDGDPVLRVCIVNPQTTEQHLRSIVASLR